MTRVLTLNDDQFEIVTTALKAFKMRAVDWRNEADDPESFDHYEDLLAGIEQTADHLEKQSNAASQGPKNGMVYLARVAQVLDKYLAYRLASDIVKEIERDRDEEDN